MVPPRAWRSINREAWAPRDGDQTTLLIVKVRADGSDAAKILRGVIGPVRVLRQVRRKTFGTVRIRTSLTTD